MRTITPKNASLIPKNAAIVFHGKIYDVYQWPQKLFNGDTKTFEMLKRPDTVNIIAIKDGKIVIQKQQQPGSSEFYSFPGGRHDDPNETELTAAKRELLEETGMTFKNYKLINITQPMSKIEWFIYTFLATDFIDQTEQNLDAGEKISMQLMTLDEVREIAKNTGPNSRLDFERDIFDNVQTIDDLKNWPEYSVD